MVSDYDLLPKGNLIRKRPPHTQGPRVVSPHCKGPAAAKSRADHKVLPTLPASKGRLQHLGSVDLHKSGLAPFLSEEILSTLRPLHLVKVYTTPGVSPTVMHMAVFGCCSDGVPCGSAGCKDVFQDRVTHVTGMSLLGGRTCLGSSHL